MRMIRLILVGVVLTGCASLGYQSTTVAVDRNALALQYAEVRAAVEVEVAQIAADCRAGRMPADRCQSLAARLPILQRLKEQVETLLLSKASQVDPAVLRQYFGEALKLLGLARGPL